MLRYHSALLLVLAFSGQAKAAELDTPSFRVVVSERCAEGEVVCQDVTALGIDKATGKQVRLKGKVLVRMCADGVTPCGRIGYGFRRGAVVYFVGDNGRLLVTRRGKTTVDEMGDWAL